MLHIYQTYGGVHADHSVHSLQVNLNQTTTIATLQITYLPSTELLIFRVNKMKFDNELSLMEEAGDAR